MMSPAGQDESSLTVSKSALQGSLVRVAKDLEGFFRDPDSGQAALRDAMETVNGISIQLQTPPQQGARVFCADLENVLQGLADGKLDPVPRTHEALKQGMLGLVRYLDRVTVGSGASALSLFPQFLKLKQVQGQENVSESTLFFPDLQVELPPSVLDQSTEMAAHELVRSERSKYQSALLQWLRHGFAIENLQSMRSAVAAVMKCAPADNRRGYWWAATAMLDCLISDGSPSVQNTMKLLSQIDLQMKALAEGRENDLGKELSELLYLVGCSHAESETINAVKQTYALDSYFPSTLSLPADKTDPILESMRAQLMMAQEGWERSAYMETVTPEFARHQFQLSTLADQLDRNTLQYLCSQIQVAAEQARSPEQVCRIQTDMAAALLLLGNGIDHYRELGDDFHKQAHLLGHRLQSGLADEAAVASDTNDDSLVKLVALYRQAAAYETEPLVAAEILSSLQLAAHETERFFADISTRSLPVQIELHLKLAYSLLFMLEQEQACNLLQTLLQTVARYNSGVIPDDSEKQSVKSVLESVINYAQELSQDQQPDVEPLLGAFNLAQALQGLIVSSSTQTAAPVAGEETHEAGELLDVFLEEAGEVLEKMRSGLDLIRSHPDDREALVTIRRGFHTLKGSGRMVGLTELGEVAASFEGALNKWLQHEKPVSPGLLRFIEDAEKSFRGWVESLSARGNANIEASELVARAKQYAAGEDPPPPASAKESPVDQAGDELLGVFLEEARDVLMRMRDSLGSLRTHPDDRETLTTIRRGFHTLKGSGRMVGLAELGDAAAAIEGVLNKWLQDESPATPELTQLIDDSEAAFSGWTEALSSNVSLKIDAASLIEAAGRLSQGGQGTGSPEPQAGAKPATAQPGVVVIGSVRVSPSLFAIATEEAAQHVEAMTRCLDTLRKDATPVSHEFMRASHTLAGVNRILGFPQIADLAFALEQWLLARMNRPIELTPKQLSLLGLSITALADMGRSVREKSEPPGRPELIEQLQDDMEVPDEARAAGQEELTTKLPPRDKPTEISRSITKTHKIKLVQDEIDDQMLPIFLEEAGELYPKISETLRELRDLPGDANLAQTLQRSLHTLKGGARMAGAMRLGEHAHHMESWVVQIMANPQHDENSWAELEHQLDTIGNILDRLRRGETTITETSLRSPELKVTEVPVAQQPTQEADSGRVIQDDVDEQLLPIFLEEANELLPRINESIKAWKKNPDNNTICLKLQRDLHTLKGGARMAGAMRLGQLIHIMEDQVTKGMVDELHEETFWGALENYLDRTGTSLEKLHTGEHAAAAKSTPVEAKKPETAATPETATPAQPKPARGADRQLPATMLRVRSDTLDHLVNEAGEISVTRARIDAELRGARAVLLELMHSVVRLRQQLREIEIQAEAQMRAHVSISDEMTEQFDPLEFDRFTRFQELTRFMNESVHDVQTVQQSLLKNLDETAAALSAQNQINRELQQSLLAIRMVPFSSVSERLYRIVRQTCKELNKKANLELYGTEVELDRSVLEKMTAPFEHLLRNSIAHGLEREEQRAKLDKPLIGDVRLSLHQEGNEVVFEFSDDGAGLDLNRLRKKGVEQGSFASENEISDEQAMQLIFSPGLSTAESVTAISGRGVGMDVVRSEITSLGGRIDVFTIPGKGTRFTIHLPLTLLVTHTLMLQAGTTTYAVQSSMVEQVQQLKQKTIETAYQQGFIEWHDHRYPLHYLRHLLGDTDLQPEMAPYNPVLLLRSGDQRIAVHVDALLGIQEVVVKNIGPQLSRLAGIAGASVLGNGSVLLILNPIQLKQRISQGARKLSRDAETEAESEHPLVMVVDDSLTVRKITSRLLARAGYLVLTAEDGVDALEKLNETMPKVILMDVEMPRMDGFELTRILHNNARTKDIPIIMITSRTADKHRNYAKELGVEFYLGKPYQEEDLLQRIEQFAPVTRTLH